MITYPLKSMTLEEASQKQFKLIDAITHEFEGLEFLNRGDLGVHPQGNMPQTTRKVERVLARFFESDDAVFVRGAGTGAIREALAAITTRGDSVLVHDAPIYTTTKTSLEHLGLNVIRCDFNNDAIIVETLKSNPTIKVALIQISRQTLDDSYDLEHVIKLMRNQSGLKIVTDDNYAVMKIANIGVECGADLSCFSTFKLLGPEGIGVVVGRQDAIDEIHKFHYSGGLQTQGHEAMEVLRGLSFAPVTHALQAIECDKVVATLNEGHIQGVDQAFVANAQSKVVLVRLKEGIAKEVLECAEKLGAAPYPVGAESKYELVPMFYKLSGTMLASLKDGKTHWIRINPMRSGHQTVIRILKEAIEKVTYVSR